jgi:hypothetical protein
MVKGDGEKAKSQMGRPEVCATVFSGKAGNGEKGHAECTHEASGQRVEGFFSCRAFLEHDSP